jgi:multidrug efflux pump subunit AcrA (membrane-fusion protein)
MSISIALSKNHRQAIRGALPWVVLGLGVALVVANFTLHDALFHHKTLNASEAGSELAPPAVGGEPAPAKLPTTVTLAEGKFKAAAVATEPARLTELPAELGVPGRIEANLDRQVPIRPRAAGVIREVHVVLGQKVKKGDLLAVLDSPDIATARLELRNRQRALATARLEAAWKKQVADNVESLLPELQKRVDSRAIQKAFADRPLGTFRATLLQAYAEYDIAAHEAEKTAGLFQKQIVGEHPMYLTQHTFEGAQAKFEGVLEQAKFDAHIQDVIAEQNARRAEADVIDAAERLRILGVPEDIGALLAHAADVAASSAQEVGKDVTAYPIVAPFDGTLVTKNAVMSQKADVNDVLFTLADLSTVWVMANIPESDFGLLPALNQGQIRLGATAYPGRSFLAKVLAIDPAVDPTTRTVPMRAETANPDGLLKVGMFVRIALDTSVAGKSLTVPAAAVVEIEGRSGVFTPDPKEPRTFHFRPVKIGREAGDRRVVASGLSEGDAVVSKGAFDLKSELILQNEEDEE